MDLFCAYRFIARGMLADTPKLPSMLAGSRPAHSRVLSHANLAALHFSRLGLQLRQHSRTTLLLTAAIITAWSAPQAAQAENPFIAPQAPRFNLYGMPGLIDMPSADVAPDAQLSTTVSHFSGITRTTVNFQLTPRLSTSFRYTALQDFVPLDYDLNTYYDRSYDLRYQLVKEGNRTPAIAIGLRDFIGTGLFGGEYIVATKSIGERLKVTAGLGWGRLGSEGSIANTGTRPIGLLAEGGVPTYDRWFRGEVAPFGGLSFAATDQLTLTAEYSSDAYAPERGISPPEAYGNNREALFERKSSLNFGLDYRFKNGAQFSLYSLYGDTVGAQLSFSTNLRQAAAPSGLETAPSVVHPLTSARDLGWNIEEAADRSGHAALQQALANDGLVYQRLDLSGQSATLILRNPRYGAEPQAIGRAARHMARLLPAHIHTFKIVPTVKGIPTASIVLQRRDLQRLQYMPADQLLARTQVLDAAEYSAALDNYSNEKRGSLGLAPYATLSVFDPDNPVRIDAGLRLTGRYKLRPNIEFSGALAHKLAGNLDSVTREIPSDLPRVRTDYAEYSRQGRTALEHLTVSHFGRPAEALYSRVTLGYLETMFAGVSAEMLWKPVDSPFAFGAEMNHVRQRDFDQKLGLRDYQTTTGHLSAYYAFGNGMHGQIDAGRYLAGDYGATFSLDREFANGWRVGAYATFTDVSAEEYGEGSFDKGLRLTIPLSWALNQPSRKQNTLKLQSLTRDGGARLNVRDRLYERVRDYHKPELIKEWGRVWR